MHCPLCGGTLTELSKPADPTELWDFDDPRWETYEWPEPDNSVWWECNHCKSFGPGFPLQQHHPLSGITSGPGDSWSLSWIK